MLYGFENSMNIFQFSYFVRVVGLDGTYPDSIFSDINELCPVPLAI